MHRLLLVFTALLLTCGCSGCPNEESGRTPEDQKPFSDVELSIAVPHGYGLAEVWEIDLDEWKVQNDNTTAEIVEYETEDAGSSLARRLGLQPDGDGPALVVFPISQIGELVAGGLLAPVPEDMQSPEALDWNGLFSGLRNGPGTVEGQPTVLPVSSPVLVGYYRKDLFAGEGLAPPQTWKEYERLLGALDERGFSAVEPWGEPFRATMFLARAVAHAAHPQQYSLFFDIDTGEPLIGNPGFVRALEQARRAVTLMRQSADVTAYSPADCRRAFFSGKAAMAVTFETAGQASRGRAPNRPDDSGSPESMQVGFFRLPGAAEVYNPEVALWEAPQQSRVNLACLTAFRGWCAGVSAEATETQQRAAWNFLSRVAVDTDSVLRAFPGDTKSACRRSHLSHPAAWVGRELAPGEAGDYLEVVAESLRDTRVLAELPVAAHDRFRGALTDGLTQVLLESAEPAEALQSVADEWRTIISDLGKRRMLNSYRRCLGLYPRRDD